MGAHDYVITIEANNEAEVRKKWEERVEEDSYESGSGAYAGNATTMRGRITFYDHKLASENEAREFCLKKHEKWSGPVAVSYYLPAEPSKTDEARKQKAMERLESLLQRSFDAQVTIHAAFVSRKSGLVGCKTCGSRLSHEHLVKNLPGGHASEYRVNLNGRPRSKTFRMPVMPSCPLCKASLLSETDLKRIAGHDEKVKQGLGAYDEALKPKAGKKIAWAVGGWAAS